MSCLQLARLRDAAIARPEDLRVDVRPQRLNKCWRGILGAVRLVVEEGVARSDQQGLVDGFANSATRTKVYLC